MLLKIVTLLYKSCFQKGLPKLDACVDLFDLVGDFDKELTISSIELAVRWNWSDCKVNRYLQTLSETQCIECKNQNVIRFIDNRPSFMKHGKDESVSSRHKKTLALSEGSRKVSRSQ